MGYCLALRTPPQNNAKKKVILHLEVISPVEMIEGSFNTTMVLQIKLHSTDTFPKSLEWEMTQQTLMMVRSFATLSSPKNWAMASL